MNNILRRCEKRKTEFEYGILYPSYLVFEYFVAAYNLLIYIGLFNNAIKCFRRPGCFGPCSGTYTAWLVPER